MKLSLVKELVAEVRAQVLEEVRDDFRKWVKDHFYGQAAKKADELEAVILDTLSNRLKPTMDNKAEAIAARLIAERLPGMFEAALSKLATDHRFIVSVVREIASLQMAASPIVLIPPKEEKPQ